MVSGPHEGAEVSKSNSKLRQENIKKERKLMIIYYVRGFLPRLLISRFLK